MLSFWRYDFPPARILMGDTGTMFVGFLLAALSIYDHGQLATAFLVLGLPILDAVWVVTRRILTGRAPWRGDLDHFHHRLLRAGLSERQTVGVICLISAVFGVLAVILHSGAKVWAGIGLLALVTTLAFSVVMLDIEKQRKKV